MPDLIVNFSLVPIPYCTEKDGFTRRSDNGLVFGAIITYFKVDAVLAVNNPRSA